VLTTPIQPLDLLEALPVSHHIPKKDLLQRNTGGSDRVKR